MPESLEAAKDVWKSWKSDSVFDGSSQQHNKIGATTSRESSDAAASEKPLTEIPPQMMDGQPHLPFQLQMEYTNLDGDRCLRVITQTKPVTKDRNIADKGLKLLQQ